MRNNGNVLMEKTGACALFAVVAGRSLQGGGRAECLLPAAHPPVLSPEGGRPCGGLRAGTGSRDQGCRANLFLSRTIVQAPALFLHIASWTLSSRRSLISMHACHSPLQPMASVSCPGKAWHMAHTALWRLRCTLQKGWIWGY